jgi:hypothetical protein
MLKKGEISLYKGCYMPPVTCATDTQTETKAVVNRLKAANISSEETEKVKPEVTE